MSATTNLYPSPRVDYFEKFRWMLASDLRTPAKLLSILAKQASLALLENIAGNPRLDSKSLTELAAHPSMEVRAAVAENPNCPPEVLFLLLTDEDPDLRYRMAENYNLPESVLEVLGNDCNPYVAHRAHTTLQRMSQPECTVHELPIFHLIQKQANSN